MSDATEHDSDRLFVVWTEGLEDRDSRWKFARDNCFDQTIVTGSEPPRFEERPEYRPCSEGCHRVAWLKDGANDEEYRVVDLPILFLPEDLRDVEIHPSQVAYEVMKRMAVLN